MSVRALLFAAEEILTAEFPAQGWEVDVKFDARPPFRGPSTSFIAIWNAQWEPGPHSNMELGLDQHIGVTFTCTKAIGFCPPDRLDKELIYRLCTGVEHCAHRITRIMQKNRWEWMCLANEYAEKELCECDPDPTESPFVCPPNWAGNDPAPRLVGADWLSAEPDDEGDFALIMDVRFRDAERIESYLQL